MKIEKAIERMKSYKKMHADEYFDMAIEALEKQTAKEPAISLMKEDIKIGNLTFKAGVKTYKCQCGEWLLPSWKYCSDCGQRLK